MAHDLTSHACLLPEEDGVEEEQMAHDLLLYQQFTEVRGGPIPAGYLDIAAVQTALDIACGVGGWVLNLASTYPHIQVTGIDSSTTAIAYGRRLAQESGLANATFLVQDMHHLEEAEGPFPLASIDLLHLDFIAPSLLTTDYPVLLQTMFRLCRPGGTLCWTEMEFPLTTSPAFEQLTAVTCLALQAAGHTFIPPSLWEIESLFEEVRQEHGLPAPPYERRSLGITAMMAHWLRDAGFKNVRLLPSAIDVSAGAEIHPAFVWKVGTFCQQIRPWLLAHQVITEQACEHLLTQVQDEVQHERFCGLCMPLTVCSTKREEGDQPQA